MDKEHTSSMENVPHTVDMSLLNKRAKIIDPGMLYGKEGLIYRILPSRPYPYHLGTDPQDPERIALARHEFEVMEEAPSERDER